MTFCDNLLKSFSENLKQLTKMDDFLLFLRFMKTVGFCTVCDNLLKSFSEFCMGTINKNG